MNKDLQIAKKTVQTEINALKKLSSSFARSSQFSKAVNLIYKTRGKVLVVGVGKSYIVGIKVSSTLSSLGTPSVAFNATDLQHGGLGTIQKNYDILLVFSVSGESSELDNILKYANRHKIDIIGVSCKSSSMLLRNSTIKILLPKVVEAGHSLAPTSSSLNFLSWGDSLAIACMKRKKWTNKKFITTHPSGTLATSLILCGNIRGLISLFLYLNIEGYALLGDDIDGTIAHHAVFAADESNDDVLTMNGTTTGNGGTIELVGLSAARWRIEAMLFASGAVATPFA